MSISQLRIDADMLAASVGYCQKIILAACCRAVVMMGEFGGAPADPNCGFAFGVAASAAGMNGGITVGVCWLHIAMFNLGEQLGETVTPFIVGVISKSLSIRSLVSVATDLYLETSRCRFNTRDMTTSFSRKAYMRGFDCRV